MLEEVLYYFKKLKTKPVKIIAAVIVLCAMLGLTGFGWDHNTKRLIICLGLTGISVMLLLAPKLPNILSVPLLVLYLLYIPKKTFERMELPFHDMNQLVDGVYLLSVLLIICVYLLCFIITLRTDLALGIGNIVLIFVFLTEYYVIKFRGDMVRPSDISAVSTAMSVMKGYDYSVSAEAVYSVLYLMFFMVLGFKVRIKMRKKIKIGIAVCSLAAVIGWYATVMYSQYPIRKDITGHYWNMTENQLLNGMGVGFFTMLRESRMEIPAGYSVEKVQKIAEEAEQAYQQDVVQNTSVKPNIIYIMNEAWSDVGVLGEFKYTKEYMPHLKELEEKGELLRGNLYVPVLGGLTANSEFEALTGNALALMSPTVIPYQNQIKHDMPSLARILEEQGYETMAMHPSGGNAWNRDNVYQYFGFDTFVDEADWQVPISFLRSYFSDECNFEEIIYRYEHRNKEKPFFLFDVTIQNHSGYYGEIPMDIKITEIGGIPKKEVGYVYDLETYLNLMKITDEALYMLLQYFETVEEPVIVCMFGDHQPFFADEAFRAFMNGSTVSEREQNLQRYITPYILWTNYETELQEREDFSANYLPVVLMQQAGLKLPPFYKFLSNLKDEYPVLSIKGCLDKDGRFYDISDLKDNTQIQKYQFMQYNQIYEKNYEADIYEKTKP